MKSRIPPQYKLRTESRQAVKEFAKIEVAKQLEEEKPATIRRVYKLSSYILNREFGFGKSRLAHYFVSTDSLMKEESEKPDFWRHLDNVVIDELGLEFERENYCDEGGIQ